MSDWGTNGLPYYSYSDEGYRSTATPHHELAIRFQLLAREHSYLMRRAIMASSIHDFKWHASCCRAYYHRARYFMGLEHDLWPPNRETRP